MGHEIFERLLLNGLPGPGDCKDKAPAACAIGLVPVLDHAHVRFGAIGSIAAYNDQLRPTRGDKFAYHLTEQGIFTAITGVALGRMSRKPTGRRYPSHAAINSTKRRPKNQ